MKKAKIHVMLKEGVLDPQGKAAHKSLESLGYKGIEGVRIGKYIEVTLADDADGDRDKLVREMCQRLLSNPVIENYEIEWEK
ncbi:MAG: phosphoribosylformylglycinamidine synthase subunit PurS [Nitrospinota bacterium]|nr:phosphoribosylformylglycinamidine synthase subunit PurS [Nitrospinota bacterium]